MNRLRELREQRKLSQPFVCSKLGICQKTLYNYEHGIGSIPDRALIKLAELYGVSIDYLLGVKKYTTVTVSDSCGEVVAVVTNNEIIEHTGYTVTLAVD